MALTEYRDSTSVLSVLAVYTQWKEDATGDTGPGDN